VSRGNSIDGIVVSIKPKAKELLDAKKVVLWSFQNMTNS
jgi:hypothetical protein